MTVSNGLIVDSQKRLIFQGNSLMNLASGSTTISNAHYLANKVYTTIIASKSKIVSVQLSINGDPTTTKNINFNALTAPNIKAGDVVFLWEITNDLSVNGLTGQQAYDEVVIFCNSVRALGGKIAVGTFIARNHSADVADLFTRGQDCNTLLRNNPSEYDLLIDLGVDSIFNEKTDADNTTYFLSDKLHLTTTGQDYAAGLISTDLLNSSLLN
ncbi:MAG: hypothetical protein A2Z57_11175 [Planctomycetes bacterium RIFCSPHIGHO2_12_39_6]|nr:MAG: hypothetical protein A2Z57_11175 [Planctomycetes bacterium RIFCSPHIGHO2_12_39_6]